MEYRSLLTHTLGVLAIALLWGCRKPDPPELVVQSPSFSMPINIDGVEMDFSPGNDDLYLFTDIHELGEGQFIFDASIHPIDQEYPMLNIRIIQQGHEPEETLANLADEEILLEWDESIGSTLQLSMEDNGQFFWDVNDVEYFENDVEIALLGNEPGFISIYSEEPGCESYMTSFWQLDGNCGVPAPFSMAHIMPIGFNEILITPPAHFENFDFVLWDVSGQPFTSVGNEPFVAEVFDLNSITINAFGGDFFDVSPLLFQTASFGDAFCFFPPFEVTQEVDDHIIVEMEYVNEQGQLFTSHGDCTGFFQPEDAFFEVHSVEDFEDNEHGQPTKKVTFSANLHLQDLFGGPLSQIDLVIEEGSIAFAY